MKGMSSIAPSLLVAVPQLRGEQFARSVILLVESNDEGAFGLVINRLTPITLSEICQQNNLPCSRELFVRMGGPCEQDRAWVLHGPAMESEHTLKVRADILLTPTWEMLGFLAQSANEPCQVYLGYAGWGPGQLEREIAEGSWLIGDLDRDLVFETGETDVWTRAIRNMGLEPGRIAHGGGGIH